MSGSSPRTWGIRHLHLYTCMFFRFIPTNVGNTRSLRAQLLRDAVHPHERGEYVGTDRLRCRLDGSSPRTWGIRCHRPGGRSAPRFIPTNVGNTHTSASFCCVPAVHPHERGEYQRRRPIMSYLDGSSPRTWGIQRIGHYGPDSLRFIPTNVGNTGSSYDDVDRPPVHPHERGEYESDRDLDLINVGSSPRTWGILTNHPGCRHRMRFIPTNVGNTSHQFFPIVPESVHPHERGEYSTSRKDIIVNDGSSPRTWGILQFV